MAPRADRAWKAACLLVLSGSAAAGAEDAGAFMAEARAMAAAQAAPPCAAPRLDGAGRVAAHALPGKVEGAAKGATGGLNRRLLLVTDGGDGAAGPPARGSLRWAVEEARRDGGGWIAFDRALEGSAVRLAATLRLPSDTTVDGGCGGVALTGPAAATLLTIADVRNVIVSGLSFSKEPYVEPGDRTGDAIGVAGDFDLVAILHNAFSRCGDGCVDIVRKRPSDRAARATVAFNRFSDHNKVMLIGTLPCAGAREAEGCDRAGNREAPSMRVTVMANAFGGTSQRHPKVVADAAVHAANNVMALSPTRYADGRASAVYGAAAGSGGALAMDGNVFVNGARREVLGGGPVSAVHQPRDTAGEADGAASVARSVSVGPVRVAQHGPDGARSAAPDAAVAALDPRPDPKRFVACLLRVAGPAGAALPWPAACDPPR